MKHFGAGKNLLVNWRDIPRITILHDARRICNMIFEEYSLWLEKLVSPRHLLIPLVASDRVLLRRDDNQIVCSYIGDWQSQCTK